MSSPAVKGSLLSAGVLVRNSGGGIAVQKARNERNPSKKVQNPSNIECGNSGGLIQFSHSIGLIVPVRFRRRSSKELKKTKSSGMSSSMHLEETTYATSVALHPSPAQKNRVGI